LPHDRQIGGFGRPVAPRLLVAIGVPGDFEEQAGFVKADVIAAVNHGEAPMLGAADVGAIIHLENAIPALAEALLIVLNVHEWGDPGAPPPVGLHGVSAHRRRFRKLAEERLESYFQVLAPDLRGHGYSDWEPPWTIATHAHDVLETLDAAGVRHAPFVGHS